MTILVSGIPQEVVQGEYSLVVDWISGTATIAISVNDGASFIDIENGSFAAPATRILQLPNCQIRSTEAGGVSTVHLDKARSFK